MGRVYTEFPIDSVLLSNYPNWPMFSAQIERALGSKMARFKIFQENVGFRVYFLKNPVLLFLDAGASDRNREIEKQMRSSKSSISSTLYAIVDGIDPDLVIEILGKSIKTRKSHLTCTELKSGKQARNKVICRKTRFRDLEEAIETLHRIQRYRRYSQESGREITHRNERRAYKCPTCLGAHLTSQVIQGEASLYVAA